MTLPMCEETPSLNLGPNSYATRVQIHSLKAIPSSSTIPSSTIPTTSAPSISTHSSSSSSSSNIPKLTDILNDKVDPQSIYSKPHFLKFLIEKHCFENYDLLTHIKSIKSNYDNYKRHNSINTWYAVYDQFFETDIVNLPADVTLNLSKFKLPNLKTLNSIEKTLLNFLRDSYYEFLSINKPLLINQVSKISNSNSNSTTPSTSTSTSAETCFTKSNYISDSNSISSNESFNIINKDLLQTIDDSEVFQYENDEEINEDDSTETKKSTVLDDLTINLNYSSDSINLSTSKTQQLESTKSTKSWSKLTNKLKWIRRSSH